MERIRTLIVDDEPLAREGIRVLLGRHDGFEIVGECVNGVEAVEAVGRLAPDLMFLDVQMPQMDGLEVLRRLEGKRMPVVIFVTAFDRYAVEAFEHHALDYLLKPFDDERFERTLRRAAEQIGQQEAHRLSRKMLELVRDFGNGREPAPQERAETSPWLTRLQIRSAGRVFFLKAEEIDWVEAADYYVKLHVGDRTHMLRESMQRLEERLDPARFARIHRSTIVNLDRVRELRSAPQGEFRVRLVDGTELKLSRTRKDELAARLDGA